MVILAVVAGIAAILFRFDRINKNTAAILRAIADIEALVRNQKNGGNTGS
jgi:hypothetical protein